MNNEPVAWLSQGGDVSRSKDYFEEMGFKDLMPLYTHPAKTLTDEEIWKLWQQHLDDEIPVFVRAILQRAIDK